MTIIKSMLAIMMVIIVSGYKSGKASFTLLGVGDGGFEFLSCSYNAKSSQSITGIKGSGPIKTETKQLNSYSGISFDICGRVKVKHGKEPKLTFKTYENILPLLSTKIIDDVLGLFRILSGFELG